ncbi:MAG TPA: hypothetical protein VE593_10500 [Nitrososphaeraceae archaeon]|nr:hypothetical protein [Nitrososphaeraceae archaeon]
MKSRGILDQPTWYSSGNCTGLVLLALKGKMSWRVEKREESLKVKL